MDNESFRVKYVSFRTPQGVFGICFPKYMSEIQIVRVGVRYLHTVVLRMSRLYYSFVGITIIWTHFQVGRRPPTFLDASRIANEIIKAEIPYDLGKIIYNKFRSVVSYQTSEMPLFREESVAAAPKLATYDSIDSDVIKSFLEFSVASMIFHAMKEGACRFVNFKR